MTDNKIIAEFTGLVISDSENYDSQIHTNVDVDLKYHTSWDWLHKVLDKIEAECILRQIMADNLQSSGHLWFTSGYLYQCGTITEVYEAVVEFIKFYNQNK
jgi:D-alanyl-D-alanine dipeptidase